MWRLRITRAAVLGSETVFIWKQIIFFTIGPARCSAATLLLTEQRDLKKGRVISMTKNEFEKAR